MKYSRHLLIGLLALLLGGCGVSVHESLKVQPETKTPIGADKTVVVLPFADYSYADNLETAYRRNLFVSENVTDQLVKNNFHLPNQEDVFLYLVNQNIINIVAYDKKKAKTLEYELQKDWSARMKSELQHYIDLSQSTGSSASVNGSPGTHGLTQQEIVKIGRHFSADYIVRGRIIQYKERQDVSWAPWKKGIVRFLVAGNHNIAVGQAKSEGYDGLDSILIGNGDLYGDIPQAVVQLRIWVQDAYTGNVVWTNRVDIKVSPVSFFADYQHDALFETATEQGVATLIDDFTKTL